MVIEQTRGTGEKGSEHILCENPMLFHFMSVADRRKCKYGEMFGPFARHKRGRLCYEFQTLIVLNEYRNEIDRGPARLRR
jgi:hypothetical protein